MEKIHIGSLLDNVATNRIPEGVKKEETNEKESKKRTNNVTVTFSIPVDIVEKVKRLSDIQDRPQSRIVSQAVREFVERWEAEHDQNGGK